MDQIKLKMLVDSYGIEKMLELADIQQEKALEVLFNEGLLDINDFFDENGELE